MLASNTMFTSINPAVSAVFLSLLLSDLAFRSAEAQNSGCHEVCSNGIDKGDLSRCLANQAPTTAAALKDAYDALVKLNLQAGAVDDQNSVLNRFNVLVESQAGGGVTSQEGLAMCLPGDRFSWSPDCDVAPPLCVNRTSYEIEMGNIGYLVDTVYHGDDRFHRYAFNATTMFETEYQSPTLTPGYQCTTNPWFQTGMCTDADILPLTCPTETMTSPNPFFNGWNTHQYYGDIGKVVVGQVLRNNDLVACMDVIEAGLDSNDDTTTDISPKDNKSAKKAKKVGKIDNKSAKKAKEVGKKDTKEKKTKV